MEQSQHRRRRAGCRHSTDCWKPYKVAARTATWWTFASRSGPILGTGPSPGGALPSRGRWSDLGGLSGARIRGRRGLPVVEVLVFAGERNVAASWLDNQKKATVREAEFRLECNILGAESVCWNLEGYRMPGYQPTVADVEKVVEWFELAGPAP